MRLVKTPSKPAGKSARQSALFEKAEEEVRTFVAASSDGSFSGGAEGAAGSTIATGPPETIAPPTVVVDADTLVTAVLGTGPDWGQLTATPTHFESDETAI